jgi:protein-S-isoprenylcysteine O-methyltransferase Ste14
MDLTPLIFISLASYFLLAALVPRLRLRWGRSRRTRTTVLQPHMGAVTCVGMTILLGSFSLPFLWRSAPREWIEGLVAAGLVLVIAGAVVDWITEPAIHRKNQ